MKERPIIFGGESIRAILDGRKTQTRRLLKPQPKCPECGPDCDPPTRLDVPARNPHWTNGWGWRQACPFGQPGDRLWVREGFRYQYEAKVGAGDVKFVRYRSDGKIKHCDEIKVAPHHLASWKHEFGGYYQTSWKPAIHMPRWASRITLEVTEVRVERLQEISDDDAAAEGVPPIPGQPDPPGAHRVAFREGWDHINAKRGYSWESNPWVWVIDFKIAGR